MKAQHKRVCESRPARSVSDGRRRSRRIRSGLVSIRSIVLLLAVTAQPAIAADVEKWADPRLTVTRGLVVWLDAARLAASRKATGLPEVKDGDAVDAWPDGSGAKRTLTQAKLDARPTYRPTGDFHAVRFDGKDINLRLSKAGQAFGEMTVFVVAAPYSCPEWFSAFLSMSATGRNDFETGLNIDQAASTAPRFEIVNVESAGAGGMRNLAKEALPYGSVVRLCVTSAVGKDGTVVWLNGKRRRPATGPTSPYPHGRVPPRGPVLHARRPARSPRVPRRRRGRSLASTGP